VAFHFGEWFPRVGFIVTNFQTPSRAVQGKRITAEIVQTPGMGRLESVVAE
jgi:hypothetical protein